MGDDERESISGRKSSWRSEQAYISSTPGRGAADWREIGRIFYPFNQISVFIGGGRQF